MKASILSFVLATAVVARASANDLHVDAAGGASYTNISQAMAASVPGDRILVHPGSYPAFHFHRGVQVIGLGSTPAEVVVARVDYHPTIPTSGYHTSLMNLTISSAAPEDSIGLSGNELAAGTLVLDGVVIESGVYLGSANANTGFYLIVSNSSVVPDPGEGFLNAAMTLGGRNYFAEIVGSRVLGWNALASGGVLAGTALRLFPGTQIRIDGSELSGGSGDEQSPYESGASSVVVGSGTPVTALRITGGAVLKGGDSQGSLPGAAGIVGNGATKTSISTGNAQIEGGAGAPAGVPAVQASSTVLGYDPHLTATPELKFAEQGIGVSSGQQCTFTWSPPSAVAVIAFSGGVVQPTAALFCPLAGESTTALVDGSSLQIVLPFLGATLQGIELYVAGAALSGSGELIVTQTVPMRLDLY